MKCSGKDLYIDFLLMTVGCISYSFSVSMFSAPNNIAPGGITGAATLINYVFPILPIGLTTIVLNIPVFILGFKYVGKIFFIKSLFCVAAVSVMIDVIRTYVSYTYSGDRLLSALCSGILSGFGLALVLMRGGSTGGTDIIAKIFHKTMPHISMGRFILAVDAVVIVLSAVVYSDLNSAIYAAVLIIIQTSVIDGILVGADKGKLIYVVSDKYKEIADGIMGEISRGVTYLDAVGAYSNEDKKIIMCAVRKNEIIKIQKIIKSTDPSAFIIVCEAGEIMGLGFKNIENN